MNTITKKRRDIEVYERYWSFTAAWTKLDGSNFNNALNVIVNYIDNHRNELIKLHNSNDDFAKSDLYKNLQNTIVLICDFKGKDATLSARKGINQFVKLGFIKPFLLGYHPLVKQFLNESNADKRQILYSKIFYESSSLASSVTKDNTNLKHIQFLLQTLDYNHELSMEDIQALMVTDITQYKKGYLTKDELNRQYRFALANGFKGRKYNQISHLSNFLERFVDLSYDKKNNKFLFADDPSVVDEEHNTVYPRDPVMHRLYRKELINESIHYYHDKVCFFTKQPLMGLVASHIKPYIVCAQEQNYDDAYNPNNGLLLSQNVDQYFDRFKVTFNENGRMIYGPEVPDNIRATYNNYIIDDFILNDQRQLFLNYHRRQFEERN